MRLLLYSITMIMLRIPSKAKKTGLLNVEDPAGPFVCPEIVEPATVVTIPTI